MLRRKFQLLGSIAMLIVSLGVDAPAKGHHKTVVVQVGSSKTEATSKIKVSFVEMIEDSRCPTDVNCVWAGNAKIKIEVTKDGKSKVIELNTTLKSKDNTFEGYTLSLEKLTPEPASNIRIDRSKYLATILLSKTVVTSKKGSKVAVRSGKA